MTKASNHLSSQLPQMSEFRQDSSHNIAQFIKFKHPKKMLKKLTLDKCFFFSIEKNQVFNGVIDIDKSRMNQGYLIVEIEDGCQFHKITSVILDIDGNKVLVGFHLNRQTIQFVIRKNHHKIILHIKEPYRLEMKFSLIWKEVILKERRSYKHLKEEDFIYNHYNKLDISLFQRH